MTTPRPSTSSTAPAASVIQAAYDDGLAARLAGRGPGSCPYDGKREKIHAHAWINEWVAGADEAAT